MTQRQSQQDLILNLKACYFDQIAKGSKQREFRLVNDYWNKRLLRDPSNPQGGYRDFRNIIIRKGYPKAGTPGRELIRPWRGAHVALLRHEHFGPDVVAVHAIVVNDDKAPT